MREWLNAQVAGGYVDYHATSASYELTPEQAQSSPTTAARSSCRMPGRWSPRCGRTKRNRSTPSRPAAASSWGEHDERLFCGVAAFFRNSYSASLVQEWLPALEGVNEKLAAGAKIADVGCGHGHSTVLMAKAFPNSRFLGFDVHEASISAARQVARDEGVDDRVTFSVTGANAYPALGYDLICFFDCLHDMGRPVEAARHAANAIASDGTVMLVEPSAGDKVEDNINPVGRLYYAASTTMCCAHAISENGTHVLGAQAGPRELESVLRSAGFGSVRTAMQTPFNMVLEARR